MDGSLVSAKCVYSCAKELVFQHRPIKALVPVTALLRRFWFAPSQTLKEQIMKLHKFHLSEWSAVNASFHTWKPSWKWTHLEFFLSVRSQTPVHLPNVQPIAVKPTLGVSKGVDVDGLRPSIF